MKEHKGREARKEATSGRATHEFIRQAGQLNLRVQPLHQEQILLFLQELLHWNQRINLTAIRNPQEILIKHFLDSLLAASLLENWGTLVDLGTGAGFPGIPIKIWNPETEVVLVESRRKKVAFLEHVVRTLKLNRIEIVQARAEDEAFLERFDGSPADIAITRAALKDMETLKVGTRIIGPQGRIVLMKGVVCESDFAGIREEADAFQLEISEVIPYRLPGLDRERNLVFLKKKGIKALKDAEETGRDSKE